MSNAIIYTECKNILKIHMEVQKIQDSQNNT